MNDLLLKLTAEMPMKQINLETNSQLDSYSFFDVDEQRFLKPYLQRYYAGSFSDEVDLWIHRFLSNDGDRHLHNHPFEFNSVILNGGYKEEFLCDNGLKVLRKWSAMGHINVYLEDFLRALKYDTTPVSFSFLSAAHRFSTVGVFDWHRIAEVQPETWSAVLVKNQRLPKWYFKSDDGDLVDMIASPRDWHKTYKVRPECGIATDDNRI